MPAAASRSVMLPRHRRGKEEAEEAESMTKRSRLLSAIGGSADLQLEMSVALARGEQMRFT